MTAAISIGLVVLTIIGMTLVVVGTALVVGQLVGRPRRRR
jgi:hypothetical protein